MSQVTALRDGALSGAWNMDHSSMMNGIKVLISEALNNLWLSCSLPFCHLKTQYSSSPEDKEQGDILEVALDN
jgi:hypothetical protein